MNATELKIAGLRLLTPRIFPDERGFFYESFRLPQFEELGLPHFVQDNVSFSKRGVIRALHFQQMPGQAKLVSCLQGAIFDVAVDLREGSPTYGKWFGVELNDVSRQMLFIPVGFAHGFCVVSESALVQYKCSSVYDPKTEKSIRWNDPTIGVEWPIQDPILSLRDQQSPFLNQL